MRVRVALIAALVCAACGGARGGVEGDRAAAPAIDASCPYATAAAWQGFLDRVAGDPRWVKTCEDETCDGAYYGFVRDEIAAVLDRCGGYLSAHSAIAACTRNLRDFTPAWMQQHSPDAYGFTADNRAYLAAQEAPDRPVGMMRPPAAIVAALPLRERITAAARQNGYRYLTHDSALGGARTFLFIPDPEGRFDQWMLLNFQGKTDPAIDADTPLSFIAVQKKDREGRPLAKVRIHFRDYAMVTEGRGISLVIREDANGKCYACHVSGMRQLIPRRTPILEAAPVKGERWTGSLADLAAARLEAFNARIRSYGMPDWEGMVVPERHGPVLGETQGCTACHDGHTRGVITVSTSVAQLARKIHLELAMPPEAGLIRLLERREMKDPALSPEERERLDRAVEARARLARELLADRSPALTRWLLETRCR